MRLQVIWYMVVNILGALLSIALLYLYPKGRGFTFTSGATTHFLQGGTLLAALLTICVSIVISAYLAFLLYAAL